MRSEYAFAPVRRAALSMCSPTSFDRPYPIYAPSRGRGSSFMVFDEEARAVEIDEQNSITAGSGLCTESEN